VGSALGRLVWPGMVLAGLALGAAVWLAWPDPDVRVVRLPYGEAMPKTPAEAVAAQRARPTAEAVAPVLEEPREDEAAAAEPAEERVLAVVEPQSQSQSQSRSPSSPWPPPVQSELELDGTFEQESPEELGAEPLPGAAVTAPPAPATG
jgi:hypothetical protein